MRPYVKLSNRVSVTRGVPLKRAFTEWKSLCRSPQCVQQSLPTGNETGMAKLVRAVSRYRIRVILILKDSKYSYLLRFRLQQNFQKHHRCYSCRTANYKTTCFQTCKLITTKSDTFEDHCRRIVGITFIYIF